jgi:hypothetical protein
MNKNLLIIIAFSLSLCRLSGAGTPDAGVQAVNKSDSAVSVSPSGNTGHHAYVKPVGHYPVHMITGNDMTVLLLGAINPTIDGKPLAIGDEIAVFTPGGECLWSVKWMGTNKNTALNVWGIDPQNPQHGGMKIGDSMCYRVWDSARGVEAKASVTYNTSGIRTPAGQLVRPTSGGVYSIDGISILSSLTAFSSPPRPISLLSPGDSGSVSADSAAFLWTRGIPGIERYRIQIAADSALTSLIFSDTLVDTACRCGKSLPRGATCWWRVQGESAGSWAAFTKPGRFYVAP